MPKSAHAEGEASFLVDLRFLCWKVHVWLYRRLLLNLTVTSEPRNKVWLTWLEGLSLGPSAIYVKPLGAQWQAGACVSFPRGPGTQNVVIFRLEFRSLMIT